MKKLRKGLCWCFAVLCLCFGLLPLPFIGTVHAGMVGLVLYGLLLGTLLYLWDGEPFITTVRVQRTLHYAGARIRFRKLSGVRPPPRWWRVLRRCWAALLALGAVIGTAFSIWMVQSAYFSAPKAGEAYTVVVLGCQVLDEEPSLMLQRRLDVAYDYLIAHPEAPVLVSGGLDKNKPLSEAAVMQNYLLGRGISQDRIFLEEESDNTEGNLQKSWAVVEAKVLPQKAAIATDGFHILRGRLYAQEAGFTASASLPSGTPWGLFPAYWVREWFALLRALLL